MEKQKSNRGRKALGDKKKRLTTVNLSPDMFFALQCEAKETGKSIASLIRKYIEVGRASDCK